MTKLLRVVPPLPQTDRGAFCIISTDTPGERLLYCNGSNVIWRTVDGLREGKATEKPEDIFCWRGHARRATCAAMSPNKEWVVSGDIGGAVRLWGAKGEHILKNEYKLWDGAVKDVSWSGDSTRIVAAGDGKEVRAVAMIWDTGSKTGEVGGHAKQINSISFRSQRPFRVVTGGEDMLVAFHQGPPFKFAKSHTVHTNFVNAVRYSPDGEFFISAGSDSRLCLYEGKEGELVKEFEKPEGITGSLWAAAWSPDGTRVATAGGDRKLRIWDRAAGAQVAEALVAAGALEDQQVGLTWPLPGKIITVCLDGRLLVWDVAPDGVRLAATVDGTQGPLTCLACDGPTGTLLQGGGEGYVAITPPDEMPRKGKIGKGVQHIVAHTAAYSGPGEAWVFSLDDCARRLSLETGEVVGEPLEVKEFVVGAAWLDVPETKLVLATSKRSVICLGAGGVEWSKGDLLARPPTALASLPASGRVAVAMDKPDSTAGGVQSTQFDIQMFGTSEGGLAPLAVLDGHLKEVTAIRFAPAGDLLASADAGHKILVWSLEPSGAAKIVISDWSFHTARVSCLDWLPCSKRLVSGSLDRHIYVWDVDAPKNKLQVVEAHKGGVTGLAACGERGFASVGHDGFLSIHQLT